MKFFRSLRCVFFAGTVAGLHAQDSNFPTLDALGLQGAPAFALSGNSPSEISRPTSLKSFGLSILSAEGGDVAFEISPFWWNNPVVGYDQVYDSDVSFTEVFKQSFTISGSHYEFERSDETDANGVSLGISFDLIRGELPQSTKNALAEFDKRFRVPTNGNDRVTPSDVEGRLNDLETQQAAIAAGDALDKGRIGLNIAFAAAASYEFADDEYNDGSLAKYGAWLTASYRADTSATSGPSPWTFLGNIRYLRDESEMNDDNFLDLGTRVIYDFQQSPLTLSAEYIYRFADNTGDTERLAALLEYQVNDDWSVFLSHGSNFDDMSRDDEIFTFAGFSFGAGNAPTYRQSSQ